MLQIIVFASMSWAIGTRHWTVAELRGLRSVQTRMTRRLGGWWPRVGEEYPQYARRTSRWAEENWAIARIPVWDVAVVTLWWRRAGHVGRLCMVEPCAGSPEWRCA